MKHYTTAEGFRRLQERLLSAREAYFRVCASNEEAAGAGDNCVWHDNFAYEENQRQMQQLSKRVRKLEEVVANAEVVPVKEGQPKRVQLGAVVRLWFEEEQEEQEYLIAGFMDGDIKARRIAYNSPLAKAMLGKEEGDWGELRVGKRLRTFEILSLSSSLEKQRSGRQTVRGI